MLLSFLGGILVGFLVMLATCIPYLVGLQRKLDWAMKFIEQQQQGIVRRAIEREKLDDTLYRLRRKL